MATWEKLPALTPEQAGFRSGCLTCGPQPIAINMDSTIAVGFGDAGITRDGTHVWSEAANHPDCELWTAQDAEDEALKDPDHDWRIYFHGPLSDAVYQRHSAGQWVLVQKGLGFA